VPPIGYYGPHTRLRDLRKGQHLEVRCGNCRHKGKVTPGSLPSHIKPAQVKLVDLPKMLKCTWCKRKSPRTEVFVLSR
jgi:hypothetical protein